MKTGLTLNLLSITLVMLLVAKYQSCLIGHASFEPNLVKEEENIPEVSDEPSVECVECFDDLKPSESSPSSDDHLNERPVIGIFTQPYNDTHDYIMASYVKFVQLAGARAVPIEWRDSDENITELVSKLNGVLYPGGSTSVRNKDGSLSDHSKKVELVTNLVKEYNEEGIHYPILAICMGFQQITQSEAPYKDTLTLREFDSANNANNVSLTEDVSESKLFEEMPDHLVEALEEENITYNHHYDGVVPDIFEKYSNLREEYHMLGVSYDEKDQEYVAVIEAKNFPIYGFQFHPEKNIYTWRTDMEIPHSRVAIEFSQFLSNFFIDEARKNFNRFDSHEEAFESRIEHIPIDFPKDGGQDIYVFEI
ncbi:unnamed protein product [Moneuplotes crassus]|uniref:folate gamma-glutamyl hydrolase n=1 Tax=Euplotes crassus TaxID=5936 RepID=A0AAD1US40_EUPCR|nr:unnamed protein product [Moneuplotes crassus]